MKEYMELKLSGIFRVKVVTKNIVLGSLGNDFMHLKINMVNMNHAMSRRKFRHPH